MGGLRSAQGVIGCWFDRSVVLQYRKIFVDVCTAEITILADPLALLHSGRSATSMILAIQKAIKFELTSSIQLRYRGRYSSEGMLLADTMVDISVLYSPKGGGPDHIPQSR